ncbi:MAG: hypothetical protein IKU45_05200, partial [Clostridia bacterium]|nr:hypothetical protein [Clostridia bacterium]
MKKRFFVFGFTALMLLGCINTAMAESDYLFWDFSETSDKYNGLNLKPNDGTAAIENGELEVSYSSGKVPEVHFLLDKEYGAITDSAVIEFDYKSEAESVNLYLQNSPNGGSVFRLKQTNNTTLRATYEASEGANSNTNTNIKTDFVRGQWYNIKFILNYADEKCSVVIDNETVLDNVCLFYNSGGLTDAFYDVLIGPDKAGTVYVDNFAVYETNSTTAFLNVRSELLDIPETAEENIDLPIALRDDITVSWESSDEEVISSSGEVTFPSMSEGDKTVELSATLSKDGESIVRTYKVHVPARLSDTEAIELAVARVSIDEKIYDEYLLPVSGENDVIIDWSVDKAELADISFVATNGFYKVTTSRQPTDEEITFTAEFSRGDVCVTKTYTTTLARLMTDKMSVEEDAASITVPTSVKEGFELPLSGTNTTVISWTSKNEEYITISGSAATVVYRDTVDKEVVLVA